MIVALALLSAAAYGAGDFLGGITSRRSAALLVNFIAGGAGFLLVLPMLLLFPGHLSEKALFWGAIAGLSLGIGQVVFYRALASGAMSLTAPLTGAVGAALPVLVAFALGEGVGFRVELGLLSGLVALILASWGKEQSDIQGSPSKRVGVSIWLVLIAGSGFAGYFIALAQAPHDSGFWSLAASQMSFFAFLSCALLGVGGELSVSAAVIRGSLAAGLLTMVAEICYLIAVQHGNLAEVVVITSLYPAFTVLLAMFWLRERLLIRQWAGVLLALVAIALIAAG
ncbi:MAG: EamA family transporter [Candidatus Dormibacteraceae bacterium]